MYRKTRYYTKYSAKYLVFPATFRVICRKIDYLWDSASLELYNGRAMTGKLWQHIQYTLTRPRVHLACNSRKMLQNKLDKPANHGQIRGMMQLYGDSSR